jgi:serine phosphatase RsbU (regulator of sigma subunit)
MNNPDDDNSLSNNRIFCIFEDRSSILWIGTFGGGLNRFDPETGTFTKYTLDINNPKSISDNFILSIYEDQSDNLWVGTVEGGLNKLDRTTGNFTRFTKKDGLPDNVVYDILEDSQGNLWMSTNRGLSRYNPNTNKFKNYDTKDGLQSNEFNTGTGFKSSSGEMFFGGVNGFNAFFPDSITDNPYIPPVVLTDFQVFNKHVPIGKTEYGRTILENSITEAKEVTLSYRDKVFSFEFAALHYYAPEKNQYAYMMQGLEQEWNYVGTRRFVSYTAMPPGKYVFKVKGSNEDGIWNEEGTSLRVTITPPIWGTWWFRIITALLLIIIIVSIFVYQLNRLKRQRTEDERRRVTETFSRVLEQGHAAVYSRRIDSDTYEHIGEGIKDITGYDVGDFSFSFWEKIILSTEMVGSLNGMSFEEVYQHVKDGKISRWISDLKIKSKSGEIRWVRDMASAMRDSNNYHNLCFGIFFDITDRKLAEQELARTTEELNVKNQEMEADLNMAREVQMAFIAKHCTQFPENVPAEHSALQFSHRYLPTSTLAGDFFDIIPISDHKAGILICDVMGHGARASLLTAYLQGLIEELMPYAEDSGMFMQKLNVGLNSIMSQFSMGIFATVFYLVADIKSGRIQYTNAGHPGPIVQKRSQGSVDTIQNKAKRPEPALGLFQDFSYSVTEDSLTDDDVLLFFTDGIYEVENNEGKMFGKERFINSVRNQIKVLPDKMLDGILEEISGFSDTKEFKDDICLLTMHVKKVNGQ